MSENKRITSSSRLLIEMERELFFIVNVIKGVSIN